MSWPPLLPDSSAAAARLSAHTQHRDDVSTANGDVSRKGHRQARGEWRSGSMLASQTQSHRLRYWRVAVLLPHKVHSGALCCRVRRNRSSSRPRPPTSRDPRPLPPTRAPRLTKHAPCSASRGVCRSQRRSARDQLVNVLCTFFLNDRPVQTSTETTHT